MSIFKKLFGKEAGQQDSADSPIVQQGPGKTEQELTEQYAALGLDKQRNLYDVIGDNSWNADLTKGEISFGNDLAFPIQVLGTFSHSSETWLWGWANTNSNIPQPLLEQALQLKAHGEQYDIPLFKNSTFDAAKNDLHLIGMIASGVFNSSAYYLADYGQGVLLVTLKSAAIDKADKSDAPRVSTVFPEAISFFEMNHRNAFKNYVERKGYSVNTQSNQVIAEKNGAKITATFDEQGRLINLKS